MRLGNPNPDRRRRAGIGEAGVPGLKSPATIDTQRISTCGVCQLGVYKGQAYAWSDGGAAPVGINHEACVQP